MIKSKRVSFVLERVAFASKIRRFEVIVVENACGNLGYYRNNVRIVEMR